MPISIPEDQWKTVGLFIYEVNLQIGQDPTSKLWYMRETSELYGTFVNDDLPYQSERQASEFALDCIRTGQLPHMGLDVPQSQRPCQGFQLKQSW